MGHYCKSCHNLGVGDLYQAEVDPLMLKVGTIWVLELSIIRPKLPTIGESWNYLGAGAFYRAKVGPFMLNVSTIWGLELFIIKLKWPTIAKGVTIWTPVFIEPK